MIRDGNLCRGCENRKKSQGQSIESMFERLSVSSSPKVSSPIVRRALENSRRRSSKKDNHRIKVKLKKKKNKENDFSNSNKNPARKLNLKKKKKKEKSKLVQKKNECPRRAKLTTELNKVKEEIEKIEHEIRDTNAKGDTIDLPEGAMSLEEYQDALEKKELKYGGKSTPREKYEAGWCYSKIKRKWIKYIKKGDAERIRSDRMAKILCLQTKLIPLTKRQAAITSEISTLSISNPLPLYSVEATKSNESVTFSEVLLVFDTNCYLHLDGPRTILECAAKIATNRRYANVSIMIPREVNNELDRLKTVRYRREWKCRRCFTFVHGKTVCYRCGMSMPYVE